MNQFKHLSDEELYLTLLSMEKAAVPGTDNVIEMLQAEITARESGQENTFHISECPPLYESTRAKGELPAPNLTCQWNPITARKCHAWLLSNEKVLHVTIQANVFLDLSPGSPIGFQYCELEIYRNAAYLKVVGKSGFVDQYDLTSDMFSHGKIL